ncbi:hypothetical protein AB0F18_30190 [Streptomyces sp. NPDC029216]|uniref:hypothetical protein n=1 Tax=Streptomyces sp. NPDC029216 TaxID=3154701 RepID=UPI0033DB21DD
MSAMKDKLGRAKEAQWISTVHERPIRKADDIVAALKDSEPGEMLIADLHGSVFEDGAWLGPRPGAPFLNLRDIPDGTLNAAVVVLTGCDGAKGAFISEVRRLTRWPAVLIGNFDTARMRDTTPVDVVNNILYWAEGGDGGPLRLKGWGDWLRRLQSESGLGYEAVEDLGAASDAA